MSQHTRRGKFRHPMATAIDRHVAKLLYAPRGTHANNTLGQKPGRNGKLSRRQVEFLCNRFGLAQFRTWVFAIGSRLA